MRVSVCVLTNRSFWKRTILAYADKLYAESWLLEKQKNGVRLPYPYVLQYEITVNQTDWAQIAKEIDEVFAQYEIPCDDISGKNNIMWLACRKRFVISRLRRIVGQRRVRQQYFNDALKWRHSIWAFWVGLLVPLLLGIWIIFKFF